MNESKLSYRAVKKISMEKKRYNAESHEEEKRKHDKFKNLNKFTMADWRKTTRVRETRLWLERNKQFNQRSDRTSLTGCHKEFKLGCKSNA